MPDALRLAVGTFTAVPVPPPRRLDATTAGRAMLLAPLTALPSALVWVGLGAAVVAGSLPPLLAGALAIAVATLLSRAMHLDGLADTADGLSAGYDRARALEVMRRGDVGPSGVAAVVLTLLVEVAALASLMASSLGLTLAVAALLGSRLAPAVACRSGMPAARPEGLGHTVAGSVGTVPLSGTIIGLSVACIVGAWTSGTAWYAVVLVLAATLACSWLVTDRVVRRLGGVTGDTIGAAIELSLCAGLVVAAVSGLAMA